MGMMCEGGVLRGSLAKEYKWGMREGSEHGRESKQKGVALGLFFNTQTFVYYTKLYVLKGFGGSERVRTRRKGDALGRCFCHPSNKQYYCFFDGCLKGSAVWAHKLPEASLATHRFQHASETRCV